MTIECDIVTNDNFHLVKKTRYVCEETNHMFIRVDSNDEIKKINKISDLNLNYDIIAISDYDKGFLSEEDIEFVCNNHDHVFLDTKKILGDWCKSVKYIKINNQEFERTKHKVSEEMFKKIIHTKGGEGCYFLDKNYPTKKVEVKDLSGAGDTFFAGLVFHYLLTNNIHDAIKFANSCATKVVQQKGVTTI
jgi:bifunctional ADP-heptose synthase (sugar kinase/adenylyltransferase)